MLYLAERAIQLWITIMNNYTNVIRRIKYEKWKKISNLRSIKLCLIVINFK